MLSATDAKTQWDGLCMQCKADLEGWGDPNGSWRGSAASNPNYGPNMFACILQLGIPAFMQYGSKTDRDTLQQAALLPGADIQATGSFCADPEVVMMARQSADQQSPPIDPAAPPVVAPPAVPAPSPAASAAAASAAQKAAGLPTWVLPVALGVGALALLGVFAKKGHARA
jgi:hypothetical protein